MKRSKHPLIALCLGAYLLLAGLPATRAAGEMREWTYRSPQSGQEVKFRAEFVQVDGVSVLLRSDDGKTYQPPLADLSAEDNAYVTAKARAEDTEYQAWTDVQGNELQVRYSGVSGRMVILATKEGGTFQVPWSRLNKEQQEYVQQTQRKSAAAMIAAVRAASRWNRVTDGIELADLTAGDLPDNGKCIRMLMFAPRDRYFLPVPSGRGRSGTLATSQTIGIGAGPVWDGSFLFPT